MAEMSRRFNFDDFDELCAEALGDRAEPELPFTREDLEQLAADEREAETVLGHMVMNAEITIEEAYDLIPIEGLRTPGRVGAVLTFPTYTERTLSASMSVDESLA